MSAIAHCIEASAVQTDDALQDMLVAVIETLETLLASKKGTRWRETVGQIVDALRDISDPGETKDADRRGSDAEVPGNAVR